MRQPMDCYWAQQIASVCSMLLLRPCSNITSIELLEDFNPRNEHGNISSRHIFQEPIWSFSFLREGTLAASTTATNYEHLQSVDINNSYCRQATLRTWLSLFQSKSLRSLKVWNLELRMLQLGDFILTRFQEGSSGITHLRLEGCTITPEVTAIWINTCKALHDFTYWSRGIINNDFTLIIEALRNHELIIHSLRIGTCSYPKNRQITVLQRFRNFSRLRNISTTADVLYT